MRSRTSKASGAAQQARMIEAVPELLDEAILNAFLAGAAELITQREDIDVPDWTQEHSRFLPEPHIFGCAPRPAPTCWSKHPGRFGGETSFVAARGCAANAWDHARPSAPLSPE